MKNIIKACIVDLTILLIAGVVYADRHQIPPPPPAIIQASDCSILTSYGFLCQDTDDGKLYKWNGVTQVEIAAGASGDMTKLVYDAGDDGFIDLEAGGLNADVSAYDGIPAITGGAVYDLDTLAELEAAVGAGAYMSDILAATDEANFKSIVNLEIGTDVLAPDGDGSALTAVDAATGDSATAFFDAGTIEHEYGGLEADVNAYDGILAITGGATYELNTLAELETAVGGGAYMSDILAATNEADFKSIVNLEIGTDVLAPDGDGSALTSVDAATGDSATAFFDAGTIEHEWGGLEADVNAYEGILAITGGATYELDTLAELETAVGGGAYMSDLLAATDEANFKSIVNLEANIDYVAPDGTFTAGLAAAATTNADDTPDVSACILGTTRMFESNANGTILDFVDASGDHTDFNDGDWFIFYLTDASTTIDFSLNDNIEGNAGVDYTGSDTQISYLLFVYESARWNLVGGPYGFSTPITFAPASITGVPITLDDDVGVTIEGGADAMADEKYNGIIVGGIDAGEGITKWNLVYLKNDSDPIWIASATAGSAAYPAFGIAVAAATDTNPVTILRQGVVRNEAWTGLTIGGPVYLGEAGNPAAGGITQTAPSTANDCVQIVGWAISDSEIYFDFSRPYQLVE
jgi:hypothetical protein